MIECIAVFNKKAADSRYGLPAALYIEIIMKKA